MKPSPGTLRDQPERAVMRSPVPVAWPEAVWGAAVVRGLDPRSRVDLVKAGTLRHLQPGERLYAAGEPADAVFIVAQGEVLLRAIRRGDRDAKGLRRAVRGDSFGEEATLRGGGCRPMTAECVEAAVVAVLPAHVLRRVIERDGGGPVAARLERTLRRAATFDLFRAAGFTEELTEEDSASLLDASEHRYLARGDALFREGDPPTHAYLVGDGMVQLQSEEDGRLHVRAYLSRGDVVGAAEVRSGRPRPVGVAASGPSWLVSLPAKELARVLRRAPRLLERLERVAEDKGEAQRALVASSNTTHHVLKDLYRLHVARSLLIIDQDACVRCGHCAWSCASVHPDGVSRLVRRGDKVVMPALEGRASLLLPNSCQHCENPACMLDCPTGAIGRDPRGDVFIREDLCIGCGNCAKGCPWENIQMAPRASAGIFAGILRVATPALKSAPEPDWVAVKCDLCAAIPTGPACVSACPTEAIARVKPDDLVPDVLDLEAGAARGASARALFVRSASAAPWFAAAALVGGAALVFRGATRATGLASGILVAALAAYAVQKRGPQVSRPRAHDSEAPRKSRAHTAFVVHVALGIVAVGVVAAHAGLRVPANAAGALVVAFWVTAFAGAFGAVAYRSIPRRLARIEREGALPEDLTGRVRAIDERTFAALTGRSDVVKVLYSRILAPYARARLGPLALVASGRTLRAEEAQVEARVRRALRGGGEGKLEGLDVLIRLAVDRRAVAAQRVLHAALRAWTPVHIGATGVILVLLVVHVVVELVYR